MKVSKAKKQARRKFFGRPEPRAMSYVEALHEIQEKRRNAKPNTSIIDIEDSRGRLPIVTAALVKKPFTFK